MFGRPKLHLLAMMLIAGVFLSFRAEASHFRGADMWATIDSNGVIKLTTRTRWREGVAPFPFAGVDSSRFGLTNFNCANGSSASLTPAVGLRAVRASDGATVYTWPANSFGLDATTTATDTSHDGYAERTQVLTIPLGGVSASGQINSPLGLPYGSYDIIWNDWSRIRGIQNIAPTDDCGGLNSGFGGRVRVIWNGTTDGGPNLSATFLPLVPRGFDYSQNLNAFSPRGRSLLYRLSPLSPYYPVFGPVTQVPGLSLDPTGQVRIPASSARTLLDNYYGEPAGAYVISVEIEDSAGWISKRDGLLAPATTSNRPPVLDPIASQTVQAGQPLTFTVRATDPDAQPLTLAATGLPAGATFTYTRGHPAVGTFTWTPTTSQVGNFGINFEAYDTGTAPLGYQDILTDSKRAVMTVQAANRPPTLQTIANLRVGVDPLNVKAFVSQTLQFEATATDPNPGDVLTYSLPILLDPSGVNRAADASLNFTVTNTTNAEGQRVGRYSWTPPSTTVGVWQATVRVDDGNGGSTQQVMFISVGTFTNQSPSFSLTPPSEIFVLAGQPVSFSMTVQDPNSGQSVTLRSTGRPSGSTFTDGIAGNPVSATFNWTPSSSQTGNFNLSFTATDSGTPAIIQTVYTVIHVAAPTPAPPAIFSLTPNRGPTAGGTRVTLRGSGLTGAVSVQLGASAVSNLVVVDPATLTFDTPPAPQGPTDVVVTSSGGTTRLTGGFLYVLPPAPPTLTSPANGTVSTNPVVTVRGSGVPGATLAILNRGISIGTLAIGSDGTFQGTITLSPGEHLLTFTQSNSNGISQPAGPVAVKIVPGVPLITAPANGFTSSSPSVMLSVSGLPGATLHVYDKGSLVAQFLIGSDGTGSADLSLGYGTHSLTATQTLNGQTSAATNPVSGSILPPAPVLATPIHGYVSTNTTVPVSGTGVPGATVNVFDNGIALATLLADGSGRFSGLLTLAHGIHPLTFSQSQTGVTGPATAAITITLVPAAPVITAPVDGSSSLNPLVTVTGTGTPGATLSLSSGGSLIATAVVDADGNFNTVISLSPGVHLLTAIQAKGGQTSAASEAVSISIRPPAPNITAPFNGFRTTNPSVTVTGTGLPGALVTAYDFGALVGSFTIDASGNLSESLMLDYGTHALTFTQTNSGGTSPLTGEIPFVVVPGAPVLTLPVNDFDTTSTAVAFAGSGVPGSTVTISNGTSSATATVDSEGNFRGTLTLAHGTHTVSATQSNGGLESSPSNSVKVLVRPAAPFLTLPVDDFDTTSTEVAFAGTGVPGSTVTVSNGISSATALVDSAGNFRGTLTLAHGTHTLSATQSNGGLESATSNSVRVLVRPAAPVLILPVDDFDTTSTEVAFAGSGVPGSTVTVSSGTSSAMALVDSAGGFRGTLTLAYGTHTLSATQSKGGLTSATSNSVKVLVRPAAPFLSLPMDNSDATGPEVAFAGSGVPGSTVTVSNGTSSATATVDGAGNFRGTLMLAYGPHTLSATQSNGGLDSAPSNSVRAQVRPAAPKLTLPVDNSDTTGPEVAFAGTGIPGFTVTVSSGTSSATATVDGAGNFRGTVTLAYGTPTLSATQSNGGFTSPPSNSVTAQVRPAAPMLEQPTDGFDTDTSTVAVLGKGIPGATVTVSNGTFSTPTPVNAAGSFKVDIDLGLTNDGVPNYGVHTLSVIQSIGVHTSVPLSVTGTFRPGPPTLIAPKTITSTEVPFHGTCVPGWEVTITDTDANGNTSATKTLCDTKRNFSATLKLAYGPHTLSATQSNGSISTATSNSVVLKVPVPVPVISTDPSKNYTAPRSARQVTVTVTGSGVPGATVDILVSFNRGTPTPQHTLTVDGEGRIAGSITLTRVTTSRETHLLTFTQKVGSNTSDPAQKDITITFP